MLEEFSLTKFKLYSVGVVAKNKALDSDIIEVLPVEITPYVEGELDGGAQNIEASGLDKYGREYTVSIKQSAAVIAEWLRLGETNRRTSPDVRRGEKVLLYRYADSDMFYWESFGTEDYLRKKETVIYSWSDTSDETKDSTAPDNCYSLEISTHRGHITLRTVKANEEPFAYVLQLNTKDGSFVITDDVDNHIELDSSNTKITLHNKDNSVVILDKKNITVSAQDSISIKAVNSVNISCKNLNANASKGIKLSCGSSTISMSPSSISISSPSVGVTQ